MKYALCLLALLFSSASQAGWCRNFWNNHIIADDPHEPYEAIEELRQLYPNPNYFRTVLEQIYETEKLREKPDQRTIIAIEQELFQ